MSIDLSGFVFTAADYKILLLIGASPFQLQTVSGISRDVTVSEESIYAIGNEGKIAVKTTGTDIKGKLELQVGELYTILTSMGLTNGTQIKNAIITVASIGSVSNPAVPVFRQIISGVNITSDAFDIKAKQGDSKISLNYTALNIN